ncbi:MAG: MDR family MFS transporter [Spirochaetales bacterium]|nr:MDR family MFS transporter [Spirochaetales bacterium]
MESKTIEGEVKIHRGAITAILTFAGFFCMLNETVLNMALTNLMSEFQVNANTVQWLSTGYMLIMAVSIPVSAFFIQTFKTRTLFCASILIFFFGTLVSGISTAFPELLIGRLIQAVGTGLLIPNIVNTLIIINPVEKRGRVLGVFNLVMFCSPAIGPTLSGLIVQYANWRWLFFSICPFSVIIFILGFIFIGNYADITKPKINIPSIILSTLGFGGLIFAVNNIGNQNHMVPILSVIIGIVALILFAVLQTKLEEPMLNLKPLCYPMFTIGVMLIFLMHMVNFAIMLMLPIYLQGALGITAFTAGLIMFPGGLLNGLLSPVAGSVYDRFGPRCVILPGYILSTVVFFLLSRIVDVKINLGLLIFLHCLSLIAVAMINTPSQTHSLNQLPPELYPHGTAISNTLQQIGGAFGTSLFIAIMSLHQNKVLTETNDSLFALASGVRFSLAIATLVLIASTVLSFFMKKNKVEA